MRNIITHTIKKARFIFFWKKINDDAVDGFIKEYRDTVSFANLAENDILPEEEQIVGDSIRQDSSQEKKSMLGDTLRTPSKPLPSGMMETNYLLANGTAQIRLPNNLTQEDILVLFDSYLKGLRTILENKIKEVAKAEPV